MLTAFEVLQDFLFSFAQTIPCSPAKLNSPVCPDILEQLLNSPLQITSSILHLINHLCSGIQGLFNPLRTRLDIQSLPWISLPFLSLLTHPLFSASEQTFLSDIFSFSPCSSLLPKSLYFLMAKLPSMLLPLHLSLPLYP